MVEGAAELRSRPADGPGPGVGRAPDISTR
jgi:hypothetical protein